MTFAEAEAALKMAPEDDQLSQVKPNMTRRNLKYNALRALNNLKHSFADPTHIPEILARQITQIAQDWTDPVKIWFMHNTCPEYGKPHYEPISVGWNREELAKRKALAVLQDKPDYQSAAEFIGLHMGGNSAQARAANKIIAEQETRIRNMAYGAMGAPAPGTDPYWDSLREKQLRGMANFMPKFDPTVIENVPMTDEILAKLRQLRQLQAAASTGNTQKRDNPPSPPPEPEKKPEPKPDPKSPTFVLKRPKLC
jgi:hypothetical protein